MARSHRGVDPRAALRGVAVIRGDVHQTRLPGLGRRPALIVSWDSVNVRLRQPIVARITATERERSLDTFVALDPGEAGAELPSYVLCHDLSTVRAQDIGVYLGTVGPTRMREVEAALRRSLDLS